MKNQLRESAIALALLLASIGFAAAAGNDWMPSNDNRFLTYAQQHQLVLSGAQQHIIFQIVSRQNGKKERAPPGFKAEIGRAVPKSIVLRRLPSDATNQVWAVRSYDYVMLENQLLIVNPQDRIVDDIITQ